MNLPSTSNVLPDRQIALDAAHGSRTLSALEPTESHLPAWVSAGKACVRGLEAHNRRTAASADRVAPDEIIAGLSAAGQWFGGFLDSGAPLPERFLPSSIRVLAADVLTRGIEAADAGVQARDLVPPIPGLQRLLRGRERDSRLLWTDCRRLARF